MMLEARQNEESAHITGSFNFVCMRSNHCRSPNFFSSLAAQLQQSSPLDFDKRQMPVTNSHTGDCTEFPTTAVYNWKETPRQENSAFQLSLQFMKHIFLPSLKDDLCWSLTLRSARKPPRQQNARISVRGFNRIEDLSNMLSKQQ